MPGVSGRRDVSADAIVDFDHHSDQVDLDGVYEYLGNPSMIVLGK